MLALARTEDRVAIWGAGAGHVAALLAGKLGVPRLTVFEQRADRRAYLAALAGENGLARLALAVPEAAALDALSPSFLAADLQAAPPLPPLTALPALRVLALQLPPDAPPERVAPVFATAADAGLVYRPDRSRGPALVFAHPMR